MAPSRLEAEILLEGALRAMLEVTGAARGYLELADGDVRFWTARGLDRASAARARAIVSTGIVAETLRAGEVVVTASASEDPRFATRESVQQIAAVLCAPIGGTERLGVAYVEGLPEGALFSPAAAEVAGELAHTIAPIARRLLGRAPQKASEIRRRFPAPSVVGHSEAITRVLEQAALAATSRAPVLLTGPTGSGKSALAREIHAASGRPGRLVTVNAANLRGDMLEADLFGVRARAATGVAARDGQLAVAHGGTLFLDEVGTMEVRHQARLLTVLESGEYHPVGADEPRRVDVRWLFATNLDLAQEVAQGRFRADLYSRIDVWTIALPSLEARTEDVGALSEAILARIADEEHTEALPLAPSALRALQAARWPDNVRGLRNALYRGLVRAQAEGRARIEPADLAQRSSGPPTYREALASWQRTWLTAQLQQHDWSVDATAAAIELSRARVYALMKELGLRRPPG